MLASTSDPPVNVDPGLVVPKLWSRNITEIQEDTFKNDVNIAKDKPKELQELLEEFARKTLGLPTALLRAEDLRRHDGKSGRYDLLIRDTMRSQSSPMCCYPLQRRGILPCFLT